MHAFEDTWRWDNEGRVQAVFDEFWLTAPEKAKQMLKSMIDALGRNDVTAYLTMMAPRLVELHRVLKPTGSLYLHCDPTASHYLKVLLDSVFGAANFLNEITWKRTSAHNSGRKFGPVHDSILFFARTPQATWNPQMRPLDGTYQDSHYSNVENGRRYKRQDLTGAGVRHGETGQPWRGINPTLKGRHWMRPPSELDKWDAEDRIYFPPKAGAWPYLKLYLDESRGMPVQDVWDDINPVNPVAKERLGYPTQKPLALLERIIAASSNLGDVVLDPFCGCGTAVHAAQKLDRRWIGIDITPLATNLIRDRMQKAFPGLKVPIEGWPSDMAGAIALAAQEDKYHFQDWAVIECGARPVASERKKGADRGIDGVIPFIDTPKHKRGVVSVKAGATGPAHVRDLAGVVARDEDVEFGVFVCLHPPTQAMIQEALNQGTWVSDYDQRTYPRIQILSAQDLIDGKLVRMPSSGTTVFAQAARERRREGVQGKLE